MVGVVPGSGLALLGVSVNIIRHNCKKCCCFNDSDYDGMAQTIAFQGATYNRRQTIKS